MQLPSCPVNICHACRCGRVTTALLCHAVLCFWQADLLQYAEQRRRQLQLPYEPLSGLPLGLGGAEWAASGAPYHPAENGQRQPWQAVLAPTWPKRQRLDAAAQAQAAQPPVVLLTLPVAPHTADGGGSAGGGVGQAATLEKAQRVLLALMQQVNRLLLLAGCCGAGTAAATAAGGDRHSHQQQPQRRTPAKQRAAGDAASLGLGRGQGAELPPAAGGHEGPMLGIVVRLAPAPAAATPPDVAPVAPLRAGQAPDLAANPEGAARGSPAAPAVQDGGCAGAAAVGTGQQGVGAPNDHDGLGVGDMQEGRPSAVGMPANDGHASIATVVAMDVDPLAAPSLLPAAAGGAAAAMPAAGRWVACARGGGRAHGDVRDNMIRGLSGWRAWGGVTARLVLILPGAGALPARVRH